MRVPRSLASTGQLRKRCPDSAVLAHQRSRPWLSWGNLSFGRRKGAREKGGGDPAPPSCGEKIPERMKGEELGKIPVQGLGVGRITPRRAEGCGVRLWGPGSGPHDPGRTCPPEPSPAPARAPAAPPAPPRPATWPRSGSPALRLTDPAPASPHSIWTGDPGPGHHLS